MVKFSVVTVSALIGVGFISLISSPLSIADDVNAKHTSAREGIKLLDLNNKPIADRSLCTKDEIIVFSCETKKAKTVSLCASPDFAMNVGVIKYRYGKYPGVVELVYPKANKPAAASFKQMTGRPELGFSDAISFHLAPYRYSVFLTMVNSGYAIAGVVVDKKEKLVSFDECIRKSIATSENASNTNYFLTIDAFGMPNAGNDISFASVGAIEGDGDRGIKAIGNDE